MSELIEKVSKELEQHFSASENHWGEHREAAQTAIKAVFDWMAKPSDGVVNEGTGALGLHDVRCAAPWDQLAGETFQAMLSQLSKEALG